MTIGIIAFILLVCTVTVVFICWRAYLKPINEADQRWAKVDAEWEERGQ